MPKQKNFYIFINPHNFMANWQANTIKQLTSSGYTFALMSEENRRAYEEDRIDYLPFIKNPSYNCFISPFCVNAMNDYRIEHDCELVRKNYFPNSPSRLSAIFAFGDMERCKQVSMKYGWPLSQVRKFELMENELTRVLKANMEIISLARHAYANSGIDQQTIESIWKAYWNNERNVKFEMLSTDLNRRILESGAITEFLIEGRLKLVE